MIGYRREIDGLRALAVLPVMLFHAGFKTFSGGFVGVDVFFVISGYLITSIILSEQEAGTFSLIHFYERRARRILPALFLVMAACIPFAWFWLSLSDMEDFSRSLSAVSVFASNILFWRESGYFDTAAELKSLLHTWSLAVEEQYYVLFPLFLIVMWRFARRWTAATLAVIALTSLAVAQWGAYYNPTAAFFLLPTRGWELAIGAIIALYLSRHGNIEVTTFTRQIGSVLGLALILYAVFSFSKKTPVPSLYTLAPTIGAALTILYATPNTFVGKVLATKVLVGIGLISYSAYLWHYPLFSFARHRSVAEVSETLYLLLSVAAFLLAYGTWRFIENPFRNRSVFTGKQIAVFSFSLSVLFIAFGMVGQITHGKYMGRDDAVRLESVEERLRVNHGLSDDCDGPFTLSDHCRTSDSPTVLVWGDSYAMHLVQGLLASKPDLKLIQTTATSCGPFFDIAHINTKYGRSRAEKCISSNDKVYELLRDSPSIRYVVMSSLFWPYIEEEANLLTRDGAVLNGPDATYDYMVKTLDRIKTLGKIPVVFSPTPQTGRNLGRCALKAVQFGEDGSVCNFALLEAKSNQKPVYDFLQKIASINPVIFLDHGICDGESCKAVKNGVFIYRDDGHLTHEGSAYVGKQMKYYALIEKAGELQLRKD